MQLYIILDADIDECLEGIHNCSVVATCQNVLGSYDCNCMTGYVGDGVTCASVFHYQYIIIAISRVDNSY